MALQDTLRTTLASGASATGAGMIWTGGLGMFTAEATWGGGSVTLQLLTAGGTWVPVGVDTTLSANGAGGFILPRGTSIRAAIATATAVFAYVTPLS